MAHKLLTEETTEPRKKSTISMPNVGGKFGISFYIGLKEVFIGISIGEVEIEHIIKRKTVKATKAKATIMHF